jgi:NitT/TauT family transport system permease protein
VSRRALGVWSARLVILVLLLGAWQWLSDQSHPATPLAGPWDVFTTLKEWSTDAQRWKDVLVTLREAATGWVLGCIAGAVVAFVLAFVHPLARLLTPIIAALNALPKLILAPVVIIWFGTGIQSKVAFVVSVVSFVVFYAVYQGLRSIDQRLVVNTRLQGASRLWMFRSVYAPAVVSWVMTSLRLSMTLALLVAVVGEFVSSTEGIGHVISVGQQRFQSDVVLAGVAVVSLMALTLDRLLVWAERHMSRWRMD